MISKTMQTILHALSYGNIEVEASRRLADIKKLDAMRIFLKKLDTKVYNGTYEVPVRLYFPNEESMSGDVSEKGKYPVLLFFHGDILLTLRYAPWTVPFCCIRGHNSPHFLSPSHRHEKTGYKSV